MARPVTCLTLKQPWAHFVLSSSQKAVSRDVPLPLALKDQFLALRVDPDYTEEEHKSWSKKFKDTPPFDELKAQLGLVVGFVKFGKSTDTKKGKQLGPSVVAYLNFPKAAPYHWLVIETKRLEEPLNYKVDRIPPNSRDPQIFEILRKDALDILCPHVFGEESSDSDSDDSSESEEEEEVERASKRRAVWDQLNAQQKKLDVRHRVLKRLRDEEMTPDMDNRFRTFWRSKLDLGTVKKLMNRTVDGVSFKDQAAVAMLAVSKVFVTSLMADALEIQKEWALRENTEGDDQKDREPGRSLPGLGPVTPAQLLEAHRRQSKSS